MEAKSGDADSGPSGSAWVPAFLAITWIRDFLGYAQQGAGLSASFRVESRGSRQLTPEDAERYRTLKSAKPDETAWTSEDLLRFFTPSLPGSSATTGERHIRRSASGAAVHWAGMNRTEANAEYSHLCGIIGMAMTQGPEPDDPDTALVEEHRQYVARKVAEAKALIRLIHDGEFGDEEESED